MTFASHYFSGQVNNVLVHWSEACHGLLYSLVKSTKGTFLLTLRLACGRDLVVVSLYVAAV